MLGDFGFERPSASTLALYGTWRGSEVHFTERDLARYPLVGRGFHWVTELPYNR